MIDKYRIKYLIEAICLMFSKSEFAFVDCLKWFNQGLLKVETKLYQFITIISPASWTAKGFC